MLGNALYLLFGKCHVVTLDFIDDTSSLKHLIKHLCQRLAVGLDAYFHTIKQPGGIDEILTGLLHKFSKHTFCIAVVRIYCDVLCKDIIGG